METLRLLPVLVILVVLTFASMSATVNGQYGRCDDSGNFTANSTFQKNLDLLLDSIPTTNSTTLNYGLFNASTSKQQDSEAIEAIGYCRGDLDGDACRGCLSFCVRQIRQQCPLKKEAILFEENCTLKYSNHSSYGELDLSERVILQSSPSVPNWDTFSTALKQLLDGLRGNASSGGTLRKYDSGRSTAGLYMLYAAVQCSPDLSDQQCSDCLDVITQMVQPLRSIGGAILFPSCRLRYENFRFFDPTISLPSPRPPPATETVLPSTPPGEKKLSKTWIVFVASTVMVVLLIGIIVFFLIVKRRRRRFPRRLRNKADEDVILVESLQFNLDVIVEATENFSVSKKLGQGGFGSVYLGKLPNGQEIAAKRLSRNSGQGQIEFKNEIVLLAKLQHRNLVRLLGFCLEGEERLLVYEFVPNSSLDQFIFDPIKRAHLNWDTRYKIITGIARGLMYLHEDSRLRIIHRDLKASNILLDLDMNPKVSDFGMARLFELDQTQADTNRIVGTYGYMAPEYALHGHISMKSDVFSFGVLVLEIVSGRKNLDYRSHSGGDPKILISHVWRSWREGKIQDIVDPSLTASYSVDIVRCIHIGLLCVQENVASRPTMASVIVMLNSHSATLSVPTQPAFLCSSDISTLVDGTSTVSQSNLLGNKGGTVEGTHSITQVSITEPYPR